MSNRVFISHASQDHEIAEAVCEALETQGVPCWIAPRDITPGKEYAHALYDAIVECRALLLVLSVNAVGSAQVRREIEQAARDGDPIIAFRTDDCEPGPALEFHIGRVEWLAPSTVDIAAQIGALATMVQAQLAAGLVRQGDIALTSTVRAWRGYPGVLRRLLATWTTVLVLISAVIAGADLIANGFAVHFARQEAIADAAQAAIQPQAALGQFPFRLPAHDENASPFKEDDPVDRVTALSAIQMIVMLPTIFVWLGWLSAASLTLEHSGVRMRHAAARAPGRFMWHFVTLRGSDVLRELWTASARLGGGATSEANHRTPRRLRALTLCVVALLPFTIFTTIVASEDEWSDVTLLSIGVATDLLWLTAAALCLGVLKPIENRLRLSEVDLKSAAAPQPGEDMRPV